MNSNPSAIIALRGWHPAISRAEAMAMFSNSKIKRIEARRLLIANGESDWGNAHRMSGCECVLVGDGIAKWESIDDLVAAKVQTLPNRLLEFLPDIIAGNIPTDPIDISPAQDDNG